MIFLANEHLGWDRLENFGVTSPLKVDTPTIMILYKRIERNNNLYIFIDNIRNNNKKLKS